MLEDLTHAMFAECLTSKFRVYPEAEDFLTLELIEAVQLRPYSRKGLLLPDREPFSLVFRGPRDRSLPQRTYRVEHDTLGTFELFLVPLCPDQEGCRYEAIFN